MLCLGNIWMATMGANAQVPGGWALLQVCPATGAAKCWTPKFNKSFHDVAGVAAIWFACRRKCNFQPRTRTQLGYIHVYNYVYIYSISRVCMGYITSWLTLLLLNLFCAQVWWIIITNKQTTAGGDGDSWIRKERREKSGRRWVNSASGLILPCQRWLVFPSGFIGQSGG